ncbi:MAG: response regulator, partial [Thermoanaerobaculia bacterium]
TAQEEATEVVLRVKDSGIGITRDILPHVFELFTQGPRTLDRSQGGLGIGLSLASKLVELHGGTIAAESRGAGLGSEFSVRLPRSNPGTVVPESILESFDERTANGYRVLVVDDNADATDSMVSLLSLEGYDTRAAYTGFQGITVATGFRPHAVILDIGLPGMNGYEVAQRLRLDATHAGIVLIALTGYGQESDRVRTQDAGFDLHLVKPVKTENLQRMMKTLLEAVRQPM